MAKNMRSCVVVIILFVVVVVAANRDCAGGGGYRNCHPTEKGGKINVHLVPHTHNDVGWLKTVDQYFYGSGYHLVGVQYILDSVIRELERDPAKRFVYVEVAFFWRWWRQQTVGTRRIVTRLVREGRLEFANGGWSMNDEAATHYNAIVDQMTWGLHRLHDAFGGCGVPRVAWHIDPFGHSKEQANLFALMGFDGFFFARLDYDDKKRRQSERTMEMVWKGRPESSLFTGALYNMYNPPPGFCFDVAFCNDPPIMDDRRLRGYNADERANAFVNFTRLQSRSYATNHIMMTMGSDFTYVDAHIWYGNMDKLMRHVNAGTDQHGVHLLYSTPSCYLKSLNDVGRRTWPVKTDDFFPYANDPHSYWTGYFTSKPALKLMIRKANNLLQACKQINAMMMSSGDDYDEKVTTLREAMGVAQHHDAVTGTARQEVTLDYAQRLSDGMDRCGEVIGNAYPGQRRVQFCHLLNVSQCEVTERNDRFVVNVYNPLLHPVTKHVRLPVRLGRYVVEDEDGNRLTNQLVPVPDPVRRIPGRKSVATHELVFKVRNVAPLRSASFRVSRTNLGSLSDTFVSNRMTDWRDFVGFTADELLRFNQFGRIKRVGSFKVSQTFGWYEGFVGNNSRPELRSSGAYIFRPTRRRPAPFKGQSAAFYADGPLVREVHQQVNSWISQVVRVYEGDPDVEFEWLVGPVPVMEDGRGKEIVTTYAAPSIDSRGNFSTDANGRQMVERQRDRRSTWTLNVTEPVSGNYYPVNTRIAISGSRRNRFMTVLTDRSQGGSSMKDGEVELMLHRRLLHDDDFGVGQALNETAFGQGLVVRGKHWLQLSAGSKVEAAKRHRFKAEQTFMDLQLSFSSSDVEVAWNSKMLRDGNNNLLFSVKRQHSFPRNVHLLTLEKWGGEGEVLLRLEHQFDVDEDPGNLSKPATVHLADLFEGVMIIKVREFALGGNIELKDLKRLKWNEDDNRHRQLIGEPPFSVMLHPMDIRTFVVTMARL